MAVLSLDEFTANVADIHGSTPDGSGVPAQQVGTWEATPLSQQGRVIGTAGGVAYGVSGSNGSRYLLVHPTAWPTNYRATIQFPVGSNFEIGVRCFFDEDDEILRGYVLQVDTEGLGAGDPIEAYVFRFGLGAEQEELWAAADNDPVPTLVALNTVSIEGDGSTLRITLNGVVIAILTDTFYAAAGSPMLASFSDTGVPDDEQTFPVPFDTAAFNALWGGSGGSDIEWLIVTDGLQEYICARILGPEGVASGSGSRTRTIIGRVPGATYQLAYQRLRRMCGMGEPQDSFHFEPVTEDVVADGSGQITVSLDYAFNRGGQAWSSVEDSQEIAPSPEINGTLSFDSVGVGTATLDRDAPVVVGTPVSVVSHRHYEGLVDADDSGVSDLAIPYLRRVWLSRTGRQQFMSSFSWPAITFTPVSHLMDVDAISGAADADQGFFGEIEVLSGEFDLHLEMEVHDVLIGGDTFWGALTLTGLTFATPGLDWFKVDDGTACTGPPDNPYPEDPPPPVPASGAVYLKKNLQWHGVPIEALGVRANLAARGALPETALRINLAWRSPVELEEFPEPDTPLPPHYDPCETLVPPIPGDVEPTPFAGNRFVGMGALPVTRIGSIFNAAKRPLGAWTPGEIGQAAARGGLVVCGPGGAAQFRRVNPATGRLEYDPALYDVFIDFIADTMGSTLIARQDDEEFGGLIIADDFRVTSIWPAGGIQYPWAQSPAGGLNNAELARIAARWLSRIPGLRLGLRVRPRAISGPIAGITFYDAQYDGPRQVGKQAQVGGGVVNETDFRNWRDAECSVLAGWGGDLMIIISLNYLHGGDGTSGQVWHDGTIFSGRFTLSPSEIMMAADGFFEDEEFADKIMGALGYQYAKREADPLPYIDGTAGILDAIVYWRNSIMALPSL